MLTTDIWYLRLPTIEGGLCDLEQHWRGGLQLMAMVLESLQVFARSCQVGCCKAHVSEIEVSLVADFMT